MALFKPVKQASGSSDRYYGICNIGLKSFEDLSSKYEWADIYLSVTVAQKDSDYDKTLRITGKLDKDDNGNLTATMGENRVVNKIHNLFAVIGCQAGINLKGDWEDYDENPIPDIAAYLNDKHGFVGMPDETPECKYIAYVYKEKSKNGSGKVFTTIYPEIFLDTAQNRTKLKEKVAWMKAQGYIKEHTDSAPAKSDEVALAGAGLDSL
jgi:hypothetical protein|tara:strand:+ start:1249 stop:1875 length:627 start_codon:yes stop_codon:yes gene_type:complete